VAPQPAVINAESGPPGASVVIDGRKEGITPANITMAAGTHNVEYALEGYQIGRQTVDLKPGETHTLKMALNALPPSRTESPKLPQQHPSEPDAGKEKKISPPQQIQPGAQPVQQKTLQPAAQKVNQDSGSDLPIKPQRNLGNLLVVLFVAVAVIGFLFLRRYKRPVQKIEETPMIQESLEIIPDFPDDGLTHDLHLGTTPVARTPERMDDAVLKKIRTQAQELPLGVVPHFGGYELMAVLGRGGMGTTFLAKRTRDGFPVALKAPHDHLLENPEFIKRFLREGSLGSTLHHPNIIRILEAGQVGKKPFIAMELLYGETVEQKLRKQKRLPMLESLEIARNVAISLDYARLKGIVHRDLKPDNIMMLHDGGLKVLDYGIAHIMDSQTLTSSSGAYLGTPSYRALRNLRVLGRLINNQIFTALELFCIAVFAARFHFPEATRLKYSKCTAPNRCLPFLPKCKYPIPFFNSFGS
ncbi:protein kinase, partial [bacterium]|nr:protein kinase [bacterium]